MRYLLFREGRIFLFRILKGEDLLETLQKFVESEKIRCGEIVAIGALTRAHLGFYDHNTRTYKDIAFDKTVEIVSLIGNISLRDGKSFVHAHIAISDEAGVAFGGHLMPGSIVFACEVTIKECEGEPPERSHDEDTGLYLWQDRK